MKKKSAIQSRHSRAARRASSPSHNLDKSLRAVKPPTEGPDHRPSILAIHHGAGVTKRSKRKAPVSSKKRKRHEKGIERAELVMDRLEKKVARSMGKGKSVKGRKTTWDELNTKLTAEGNSKEAGHEQQEDLEGEDEHMSVESEDVAEHPTVDGTSSPRLPEAAAVALPGSDDDDGIL
ncbi:MAG: hypothetical protein M1816_004850 [Peltula sp. TS41687]|nr:MAG: hypothetical protein M1816_004850 [Peltula sp. TS41687]